MLKKKEAMQKVLVTEDVICNICEASCNRAPEREVSYEYALISANWGYFSPKDLDEHEAHVCYACYEEKLMPLFKIDPLKCQKATVWE